MRSFDGTTARVTVPDSGSLDLTTGMTLEAWVYPTVAGGWRDVIYKGPDDIYFPGGLVGFEGAGDGGISSDRREPGVAVECRWSHLAATLTGARCGCCGRCAGVEPASVGADRYPRGD